MNSVSKRIDYLFRSTNGLILMAMAVVSIITVTWGMLSGPMAEWGVREVTIRLLGMQMVQAEREARIIMLYHTIAMVIIAIEVYIMTDILPMKRQSQVLINGTVTFGYMLTVVFGMLFAYWGQNFMFHGLYLLGLSLIFFAGILLSIALWPWRPEYRLPADSPYAHTKKGLDLERTAFFVMAIATLLSASFGAITGSYWGNGHETFLAEDLIRTPIRTALQGAIIGHLHIMLTLIAIAITLIVGRWMDFKGRLHKIAMILMIIGTIIITIGALSVVWVDWAHTTIYVGSVFVMLAALLYVIYTWRKLINDRVAELGLEKPTFGQKVKALVHDPLKFGPGWQMVFMNFTVSGIGIFMAVKLDEIIRVWPHRDERITLTGHWHILASLIATIILLYFADRVGLMGRVRKWFGWSIIVMSNLAFGAVTIFAMKRLFVAEAGQQSIVNWTMLLTDIGLFTVLVVLGIFMFWRLIDLFRAKGFWSEDMAAEKRAVALQEIEEQRKRIDELNKALKETAS